MLPYYIVDVFAQARYEGNPLAVFDCRTHAPSDAEMGQMTREVGFQESTFIMGGSVEEGFQVRIFTPEYEVPFAGHPTLGTAWVLANCIAHTGDARLTLHLGVGPVPVTWVGETAWLQAAQPTFGAEFNRAQLAALLHLPVSALQKEWPVRLVSTGLPYLIVPLTSLDALRNIEIDANEYESWAIRHELHKSNSTTGFTTALYVVCWETYKPENDLNARMLCLENGKIVEDYATGSAASCLLAYLLNQRGPSEDPIRQRVEQGYEVGRPSLLELNGILTGEGFYGLAIGGQIQYVARGEWG